MGKVDALRVASLGSARNLPKELERMTTTARIVKAGTIAVAAFCAGATTAAWRGWGESTVAVEVLNGSTQPINSFVVHYGTCGGRGHAYGGELLPGQARTVRYSVCGEGGYSVEATFQDGSTVKGGGTYVMSGSSTKETVTERGVATDDQPYRF